MFHLQPPNKNHGDYMDFDLQIQEKIGGASSNCFRSILCVAGVVRNLITSADTPRHKNRLRSANLWPVKHLLFRN